MAKEYEVVIGLEIHAELSTESKIFCTCKNQFGAEVNTLVCPVCMGMPGTLPVLNQQVVDYALRMGLALHCQINRVTKMDRKNYFYPDLPKAYQISQFDVPLCQNGYLDVLVGDEVKRVGITRIHMEEDAGKLLHDDNFEGVLADYNRCGVPLIEIVSEPDMRTAEEAKAYMETIHTILLYLGISDAKMQEGSLRADVNVSVREKGAKEFGTRTEMKNVNSFGGVFRAIQYESARQIAVVEAGGTITQETRRWDDMAGESVSLRSKEDAHDYRYFPDPDLLTLIVPEEQVEGIQASLPELPTEKTLRYMKEFGLPRYDAGLLAENKDKAEFLEKTVGEFGAEPKAAANWLLGDVSRLLNEKNMTLADTALTPKNLAAMLEAIKKGTISNTAGKTVLEVIVAEDKDPAAVMQEKGLLQVSDEGALSAIVGEVLAANPKAVEDYKKGKTNVLGFLVGQCMAKTKGKGNPEVLRGLLEKELQN